MENRTNPFSKIKLVYKRSRTVTKVALLGVIIVSMITLLTLQYFIGRSRERQEQMRAEAAALEQQNQELQNRLDSDPDIEQIAGEQLGLVDPDKIIFDINP